MLSLREAARMSNPKNNFAGGRCNCKSRCETNRCLCRQRDAPCISKCHGGTSCTNCVSSMMKDETKESLPRKRQKTAPVISDSESDSEPMGIDDLWLPDLHLNTTDKEILTGGGWLNDKHMAAQLLLKRQFPHVHGLQPTILSQNNGWSIMKEGGVQILNENNLHWLCISTIGCPDNVVDKVYDSIRSKHLSHHVKEQVAGILHSKENSITITSMESQLQSRQHQ